LSVGRPGPWANVSGPDAGKQVRVRAGDEFGEVRAAEGEVPVDGLPGADLNVTTGQDVVVGVICGYEQGGYTRPCSTRRSSPRTCPLYATAMAGG
jgi:hypothetical protein